MTKKIIPIWNPANGRYENDIPAFCTNPWVELFINADGSYRSCCGTPSALSLKANSIHEYMTSPIIQEIRSAGLSGVWHPACADCESHEKYGESSRRIKALSNNIDDLLAYNDVSKYRVSNIELAFSNLCNFKCRHCTPRQSSGLAHESNILHGTSFPKLNRSNNEEIISEVLNDLLPTLKTLTLSGGESTLQPESWFIVNELIRRGRTDIKIVMSTNGSNLTANQSQWASVWNKFDVSHIVVSLDAVGDASSYWRHGTNWDLVINNLAELLSTLGPLRVSVNITMSWANVYSAISALRKCIEMGITRITLNRICNPSYLAMWAIPDFKKVEIENMIRQSDLFQYKFVSLAQFSDLVDFMHSKPPMNQDELRIAFANMQKVDKYRGEDFFAVFPEHENLRSYLT